MEGDAVLVDCDRGRAMGCATLCCRLIVRLGPGERDPGMPEKGPGRCVDKDPRDALCVYLDRDTHRCTQWPNRPRVCAGYNCNDDPLLQKVLRDGFVSLAALVRSRSPTSSRPHIRIPAIRRPISEWPADESPIAGPGAFRQHENERPIQWPFRLAIARPIGDNLKTMERLELGRLPAAAKLHERPSGTELHGLVADCIGSVRSLNLRGFETGDPGLVTQVAVPKTLALVEYAIVLMRHVLAEYDRPESDDLEFELPSEDSGNFFAAVDSLMDGDDSGQRLADLAFMAKMELGGRKTVLEGVDPSNSHWENIAICSSSSRRILKAMTAVERALREKEGLSVELDEGFVSELTHALEIRRVYSSFRKAITSGGPPAPRNSTEDFGWGASRSPCCWGEMCTPSSESWIASRFGNSRVES